MELISPTEFAKDKVQAVQDFSVLAGRSVTNLFRMPRYLPDMIQQADLIGFGSLPIVVLTGLSIGAELDRFDCRALLMCGVAGGLDPALGVGDIVVGTSNTQHDFGLHREAGFHTIQPGSRPSKGEEWKPGYVVADTIVARLRAAVAGLVLEPLPEAVGAGLREPTVHFGGILTGNARMQASTTTSVPMPPAKTAGTAPMKFPTTPARKSPIWFDL